MAYNSHGHTTAAWTTVFLIFAGFVVGGIGVIAGNWVLFWAGGVGVVVLALIVGKVMQMMGMGQLPRPGAEAPAAPSTAGVAAEGSDG